MDLLCVRDLHIKCRFQHMLQIHRHHHPSHQEHGEILMTKYMIENTFWMENVLHKAIFFLLPGWMSSFGELDSLTDSSSFCVEKWQQLWSLPVQLWHDMPLILRNSSQICKEKYTILVTYQKWYVFFLWFKRQFWIQISFQSNENCGPCQAVKEHIHYIVIFKYEKCKNEI